MVGYMTREPTSARNVRFLWSCSLSLIPHFLDRQWPFTLRIFLSLAHQTMRLFVEERQSSPFWCFVPLGSSQLFDVGSQQPLFPVHFYNRPANSRVISGPMASMMQPSLSRWIFLPFHAWFMALSATFQRKVVDAPVSELRVTRKGRRIFVVVRGGIPIMCKVRGNGRVGLFLDKVGFSSRDCTKRWWWWIHRWIRWLAMNRIILAVSDKVSTTAGRLTHGLLIINLQSSDWCDCWIDWNGPFFPCCWDLDWAGARWMDAFAIVVWMIFVGPFLSFGSIEGKKHCIYPCLRKLHTVSKMSYNIN